jgi:hypothetical protein
MVWRITSETPHHEWDSPARTHLANGVCAFSLLVGIGVRGCGEVDSEQPNQARTDEPALRYSSGARSAAERLGKIYLAEVAPDLAPSKIEAIRAPIESLVADANSEADAIERLHEAVRGDFGALRIYRLEGWTLSQTELAICALAALDTKQA